MARIPLFLAALLLTSLLSTAWAIDLPNNGRLTVVSETGLVLGTGGVSDGRLTLTLEVGAEGFVTLLIEGSDGTILSLEGVVTASGQVVLDVDGEFQDLSAITVAAGGSAEVAFEDRIAHGVEDITQLPQPAQDGIAGAIANHEAAMENAAEGKAHAGGNANAGSGGDDDQPEEADPETGGEVGVQVGLEVGVGASAGSQGANRP